jgi:hypothetical protein
MVQMKSMIIIAIAGVQYFIIPFAGLQAINRLLCIHDHRILSYGSSTLQENSRPGFVWCTIF